MSQINDQNPSKLSIDVGDALSRNIAIHTNVNQEIIVTTADKMRIVLTETKDVLISQRDWWTPFGLLVSFITTLCTADFKEAAGISKEVWNAIFILMSIFSFLWFARSIQQLIKYWGQDNMESIISKIKVDNVPLQQKP